MWHRKVNCQNVLIDCLWNDGSLLHQTWHERTMSDVTSGYPRTLLSIKKNDPNFNTMSAVKRLSDFTPVDLVEHPILANKHLLSPTRRMVEVVWSIANKTCCQFCDGMHAVGKHKHGIKTIWHGSNGDIRRVIFKTHTGYMRLTGLIKRSITQLRRLFYSLFLHLP